MNHDQNFKNLILDYPHAALGLSSLWKSMQKMKRSSSMH